MAPGGELALIRMLRSRASHAGSALRLGIGDDCAVLRPPAGHDVLVTTDFSLEGRHFRRDWHPVAAVGHRCLLRGLSDLAAMGARPLGAFLSLALPPGMLATAGGKRWVNGFVAGLMTLAEQTGTPLAGGDTAAAPGGEILADIVLLGSAPRGTELRRSGARPGDGLYVTGALGGASAELDLLAAQPRRFRRASATGDHPHLFPAPRLAVGARLRSATLAASAMDLSDGLSTDLHHLCEESGVGAVVRADALPLHPLLRALPRTQALHHALDGGEDYELLFTARPGARVPKRIARVPITRIGSMTKDPAVLLENQGRTRPLRRGGWEHRL